MTKLVELLILHSSGASLKKMIIKHLPLQQIQITCHLKT